MSDTSLPVIAIVVPCYNEQDALPLTISALLSILDRMATEGVASPRSYILCVNDGSRDKTWDTLKELHAADPRVKAVSLAHNRGHQNALLAGLSAVTDRCDAAISIDADLQDDPEAIIDMVRRFDNGKGDEIVYGVRSDRSSDSFFKRSTAHAFYNLQRRMGVEAVFDHADYRLMSNRALQLLAMYPEKNLFLRGIIPNIGLRNSTVTYRRNPRVAGQSKYPLSKMLSFSIDGITSFSAKPMRLIFAIGATILLLDILVAIWVLVAYFCGHVTSGWPSLMLSVWFLGGLILLSIGIVGEYIGKIFIEVKNRPRFAIAETLWD